jgi:hypothetical protein
MRMGRETKIPLVVLSAIFIAMLSISWGRWPDPIVDFGRDLYIPWQITEGKTLGRDLLQWAAGSLPPYLNALAFAVFGASLRTLVLVNLVLLAGLTWLLFVLLRALGDWRSATGAAAFFLAVFAFGQYVTTGNYNYVAPYTHGATHGLLFALASLALSWRHARTSATRDLALASLALGAVSLTKLEIFVACAPALVLMTALRLRDAPDASTRRRWALAATLPALVPPLLSLGLLTVKAGPGAAWQATFAPWLVLGSRLPRMPFYRSVLGVDQPLRNTALMGTWLAGYLLLFGAAAQLDLRARSERSRRLAALLAPTILVAVAWFTLPKWIWYEATRPLPVLAAAAAGASVVFAWRAPRPCPPAVLLRAGLTTFALLLLAKVVLNVTFGHYGFILAMPATLLLVNGLLFEAPRALRARGGSGVVFGAVAWTAIAFVALLQARVAMWAYDRKTEPVGSGADLFLGDQRAPFVSAMVEVLEASGQPGSLAVLPEGVMINYLSRRVSPSPYLSHLPDVLAIFGEEALLAPLKAAPPRFVIVTNRVSPEYGATVFGKDYAQQTLRWLEDHYETMAVLGSPFDPKSYGVMLLRHREGRPSAAPRP